MGYAKRYLLACALVAILLASGLPSAVPQDAGIVPSGAVLPGAGGNATFELPVINRSYVLEASMTVSGGGAETKVVRRATAATALAFSGGVDFTEARPDLSWYMGDVVPPGSVDMAAAIDSQYLTTASALFAYQMFLIDVDPRDLQALSVGWTGHASSTTGTTTLYGASLYVYSNLSREWSLVATYDIDAPDDRGLGSGEKLAPWRYVNRTLPGDTRVIVLVVSHTGFSSTISTDAVNVTETHASYGRPRVDVGADGTVEWGFGTIPATGGLGYVDVFDDGSQEADIAFPTGGGYNSSTSILVPRGATVDRAFLDYVAFPTRGERVASGDGVIAPSGGRAPDLSIGGLPYNAHQTNSSVLLTDATKLNVTEQRQDRREGLMSLDLGAGVTSHSSWAQTFTPDRTGRLRGVAVYVVDKFGSPGNVTCKVVTTLSPGGAPTNVAIGQETTIIGDDVVLGAWNYFPIDGAWLDAGTRYALVVMAKNAANGMSIDHYMLGFNATDIYPDGQAFLSESVNATTPWQSRPYDLAFRTNMDFAIDPTDAQSLDVAGVPGKFVAGKVYFNVSGVQYAGSNWTFNVTNLNAFDVSFNWTASTDFLLYADSPRLDVGDDESVDWTGELIATAAGLDITSALNAVLAVADWPHVHEDIYGNEFLRVPLNLSAATEGAVALRHPAVHYALSVNTTDVSASVNAAKASLAADAEGLVRVPANVSSDRAGRFNVTGWHLAYDLPPWAIDIPDVEVLEDGPMVGGALYLDTICFDDHDNNALEYTVLRDGGDPNVSFRLMASNALSFSGPTNWTGSATFHVSMRDHRGLVNASNTFRVTILPVNDAPVIVGLHDLRPMFDIPTVVPLDIVDSDSPLGDLTVTTNSSRATYDAENRSLVLLYPNGSRPEEVRLTVSDRVNASVYTVLVTPIASDTPPVAHLPERFHVNFDSQGLFDLSSYVTDKESPARAMAWSVNGTSQGFISAINGGYMLQLIPVARVPGNYTLRLRVEDPDGNAVDASVIVELSSAQRHAPVILRGDDALPRVLKVERGETLVINLALNRYWYDQEDFNQPSKVRWEAASLRPKLFGVSIDSDQRLHITAEDTLGSGYFTLRLYDSDNLTSPPESVQVQVVEPKAQGTSWVCWALAVLVLVVAVVGLTAVSRRGRRTAPAKVTPRERPPDRSAGGAAVAGPGVVTATRAAPVPEAPEPAPVPVPARIQDLLVVHENTSLVAQFSRGGDYALLPEKFDELVELATLFAEERLVGVKVGTIKAFRFDGTEVLVGKGLNYFLVSRCSGNQFDDVAAEMKKSMINIDVQLSERLGKWFPGQKVAELESELKDLIEGPSQG